MKVIRHKFLVGFKNSFIAYGVFVSHRYYMIEISPSLYCPAIILYKGYSKPKLKNITFLAFVFFPFILARIIVERIWYVCWCPFEFFVQTVIKESFVTSLYEKVGGYSMFFLMLYGLYRLIVG
jgi:hypothetical protein